MFKPLYFNILLVFLWTPLCHAYIATELIEKQVGNCTIYFRHEADIDPKFKTATLRAGVQKYNQNCEVTTDDFLELLGQVLESLKERKDLRPVDNIDLGHIVGLPSRTIHDEILAYYNSIMPKELEKALQASGNWSHPANIPLFKPLDAALQTTQFFKKLSIKLSVLGYEIQKIGYEKFNINTQENKKRIDAYIYSIKLKQTQKY